MICQKQWNGSSLDPFVHLGKEPQTKFPFQIIRSFTFIPLVLTNFAFLWVSLNSFILKSYSLVRINFNYSKVVFHQLCIILSHVNFQYLNFMEHWFPIIRYTLLIIFLLHLFSFAILFPCHLEGQDTSLLIFPVKYVKHRLCSVCYRWTIIYNFCENFASSRICCRNLNVNGQILNQAKKMQNFGMKF